MHPFLTSFWVAIGFSCGIIAIAIAIDIIKMIIGFFAK